MKEFENREAAFASQNYDPSKVEMTGVPEHIVEAAKAFVNLCVAHDAVNPEFDADYSNGDQRKYEAIHDMDSDDAPGSASGSRFAFHDDGDWSSRSAVGARLVSESAKATRHIAAICHEDYEKFKVYKRDVKKG